MILAAEHGAAAAPWGLIFGIFFGFWAFVLIVLNVFLPILLKKAEKQSKHGGH
jgi:F0F1-type ATP synthase assembly protein I